ncbi:MAG: pilus assembly protein PilM [Oscillibacter sp.]|jgi:type IV pilus assembly protein PilM|nr:pilus assembly protein PilM [Oscillibacter sp.]
MANTYLGLDIGASAVKLAVVRDGRVQKLRTAPLPDHLMTAGGVTSPDALADELRALLHREHITVKKAALALPPEDAFIRRVTVPYMTTEQLLVNLPYEFHDYIQKDKDLYFYDYAVDAVKRNESGEPKELELTACAALKESIAEWRGVLRKVGVKLTAAMPEYLTYRSLIAAYETAHKDDHPAEYCIADLGHSAIRVHMYRGSNYETSRVIECGGASIDALIADTVSVDPHVAADYKLANYAGTQEIPACRDLYAKIAVEILRAINFYGFNTPDSDLQDIYFCGGLAKVTALMETITASLELKVHNISQLLPLPEDAGDLAVICPAAIGAAMGTEARA